jgi:hypothetical protein
MFIWAIKMFRRMINKLAGTVQLILRVGAGAGFSPNISPDPPTLSMNVKSSPRYKKLKVKKGKCLPDGEKEVKIARGLHTCNMLLNANFVIPRKSQKKMKDFVFIE